MAGFHVMADARGMHVQPTVRRITTSELWDALRLGFEDFWAKPSHYVFLCLIYPIVGLILTQWTSGANAIQLIYPLMSGFALLGPFAALGLYEISRRRELGMNTSWRHAFDVRRSSAVPSIAVIGGRCSCCGSTPRNRSTLGCSATSRRPRLVASSATC